MDNPDEAVIVNALVRQVLVAAQEHEITETHCIAKGDPDCRFEVGEAKT